MQFILTCADDLCGGYVSSQYLSSYDTIDEAQKGMIDSVVRHCEEFIIDRQDESIPKFGEVSICNIREYIEYISNRLEEYMVSPGVNEIYLKGKYTLSYNINQIGK